MSWHLWLEFILDFIKESNAIEGIFGAEDVDQSFKAWEFLKDAKAVTKREILKVHALIMQDLNPQIAGHLRKCNVRVGDDVKIKWSEIPLQLDLLLAVKPYDALSCLDWHIQFENVHPFEDGNGRTGRMLYAKHCYDLGITPIMFRNKDKRGYYDFWKKPKGK